MYMEIETPRQGQGQMHGDRRTTRQPEATQLRRRAEDQLLPGPGIGLPLNHADVQHILRELQLMTEANGDLEAFNVTIAHDLCSSITVISGYCQVLTEICRDQLDDQGKAYLGSIYHATLDMKQLIASLLNFSRASRVELRREKIDLSKMANVVAAQLKLSAPGRPVTFRIARGITVEGDPGLCRCILDNIIGNAWKHTVEVEKTIIEFGMTRPAGTPTFFVRDNGPGFDMSFADRLFAPFQRLPGTEVEGHGIGLATVDRIVRRHGGRVWAESKPGEGATFFISMG